MQRTASLLVFGILISLGIFARALDLGTHFSHVDDLGVARTLVEAKQKPAPAETGLGEKASWWLDQLTCVPNHWTYAPLQYFITYWLVHPSQTYRQALFWGRLPSFLFSILGFFAVFVLYKKYDRLKSPAFLWFLFLIALSWENILYAKQMESYAIGVTAAIFLLILLIQRLRSQDFSLAALAKTGMGAGILCTTQYQILFFMPAFWAVLFCDHWAKERKESRPRLVLKMFAAFGIFFFFFTVLYLKFLKRQNATAGVTWNAGPNHEFLFSPGPHTGLLAKGAALVVFLAKNFFTVFSNTLAFLKESHPLSGPISFFLLLLLILGIVKLAFSKRRLHRSLLLFFALSALTWAMLVAGQKIAFSPTRHSLILLPFFAFLIGEGWGRPKALAFIRRGHLACLGLFSLLFLAGLPGILQERKDPFDENRLAELFTRHQVGSVITADYTQQVSLMRKIYENFNYYESETMWAPFKVRSVPPHQTLAFLNHRVPFDENLFKTMQTKINLYHLINNRPQFVIRGSLNDYKIIYKEEKKSDTEIDFSNRTQNGSNNFHLTILQKK